MEKIEAQNVKLKQRNRKLKYELEKLKEIEEEHKRINGELREENKKCKEVIYEIIDYIDTKRIREKAIIDIDVLEEILKEVV